MPQLDIVYIFPVFLWAWLTIILISQKMAPFMLTTKPKSPSPTKNQPKMLSLPWT